MVDLDGTVYIDEELVTGAKDFLAALVESEIPHLFLSNNSSTSGNVYLQRLLGLGIAATRENIMTSGDATIEYLRRRTTHKAPYVVGTEALLGDFRKAGFDVDSEAPDCVVVAFDTTLTFAKLERACTLLFEGAPYYATHPDKTCITARGLIPDIAAIIAACEAVTGRVPLIIGKPAEHIVDLALEVLGTSVEQTAIVGDQLDTDMTMGRQSGLVACLMMSGETKSVHLAKVPEADRPDVVVTNIGELHKLCRFG